MKLLIFLLIVGALVYFVCTKILSRFKTPHLNALNVVTGEVKSGKTISIVAMGIKEIRKRQFKVKLTK